MYQLDITRPGSIEPGLHARITSDQKLMVEKLLETKIDAGLFAWLLDGDFDYDAPEGAGESVEAYRG